MSELTDRFSAIFREEHRAVRDLLLDLVDAFRRRSVQRARDLLGRIAALTGPHFRYEEEAMYPALVEIFGRRYVEKLFADHDGAIRSAERLVALASAAALQDRDVEEGVDLVRGILPHVSDCDGLSLMVERLADDTVRRLLEARERSNAAGLDLLRWAREVRRPPALAAT
jgi:hypothetical protein